MTCLVCVFSRPPCTKRLWRVSANVVADAWARNWGCVSVKIIMFAMFINRTSIKLLSLQSRGCKSLVEGNRRTLWKSYNAHLVIYLTFGHQCPSSADTQCHLQVLLQHVHCLSYPATCYTIYCKPNGFSPPWVGRPPSLLSFSQWSQVECHSSLSVNFSRVGGSIQNCGWKACPN